MPDLHAGSSDVIQGVQASDSVWSTRIPDTHPSRLEIASHRAYLEKLASRVEMKHRLGFNGNREGRSL
jgi:hypothetical protein